MAHEHEHEDAPERLPLAFALITCSDTRTLETDTAGNVLVELIESRGWEVVARTIVPDERVVIGDGIIAAVNNYNADIVLTCGGTGLSPRDVTPEATIDVCDREVPGIAEAMRAHSMRITGRAMLSRATAAQRGTSLVVNFPGSRKAAMENWEAIADQFEHAVDMAAGGGH